MLKILAAALVLRLINLNQSLWLDEAISYFAVKNYDWWGILTKFSPGDVHPPLYYLVLKLWTDLFGYSEISLRAPSVIAGILTVLLVVKIGEKLFNRPVGLLAGLFLAVNPLAVYYSQEARMYSLVTLAVTIAVFGFITRRRWLFFGALTAAFYLDYIPWLILPVFFPLGLVPLIFVLPWLPTMWQQFQTSLQMAREVPLWGQVVGGFSFKALLLTPVKFVFGRIPSHPLMALPMLPYFWVIAHARQRLLWSWFALPILLGSLISLFVPIFTYHRFLFVLPAFMLLLASVAGRKSAIFIVTVSVVSLAIFNLNPALQREDWRSATIYVNSDPGRVILPSFAQDAALRYYGAKMDQKDSPAYLVRYVQEIFDPTDSQRIFLEKTGYKNVEQRNFNGVVIWKYVL
ncbi:glycosyltransferase family 39 protein [Candidatus Microgenomates bacterium]|nr:glycosyltransferase family 39 protein [Candidatus Microgenomates bacterium]